ncbi:tetratricopeptide repeat protein [bacterium]|nr:tetratricopeptide repeat protein [bacterium]
MQVWAVSFLSLLLINCATFRGSKDSANPYVELAEKQLATGQNPQALSTLLKGESVDPDNPLVHNQLGLVYFAFKKFEKSAEHFKRAIRLDEKLSEARNNYARTLIELKLYAEARSQLDVVVNDLTYLKQPLAYSNYGLSFFREGQYKKAIPWLQKSIALNKNNCLTYTTYGRSLYELKDYRGAIPIFDIAVHLCKKSNFDEAHYFAALTYFKSGDKTKGIALMNETLLIYPDGSYQEKAKSMLELMRMNKIGL